MRGRLTGALAACGLAACGLAACASSQVADDGDGGGSGVDGAAADAPAGDAAIDASPDARPDAMAAMATWRDDSAADFAPAITLDQAAIEAYGAIAPAAYYTGGLLWHASDSATFSDPANTTWAQVTAFPATTRVAIARSTALSFGASTPPSVGLTDGDTWSMWFEGEVYLDAGTYTFALLVDDWGFVELAPPGTPSFQRVVDATWPTESSGSFTAAGAGWYPIRYAIAEAAGDALVQLRIQGGPFAGLQAIPRGRLRTRTSGVIGMFMSGFDDSQLVGDVQHTLDQITPANTDWNTGNPGDLAMTASDDWSVRWTGQLRIDAGGAFTFRYVTDDGQRLWVDGQKLLDAWDRTTHDQTTAAVDLAPGWHELVVDHTEAGGGARSTLSVATGPEMAGQTLALDRLRPVEGRSERYEAGVDHTVRTIPDSGQAPDAVVTLVAPSGAVVTGVDVAYTFTHAYWGDLVITLIAPSGASAVLRNRADGATSGTLTERFERSDLNGGPASGAWTLRVNDAAAQDSGTVQDFAITVHHVAGEPPIATAAAYESQVKDLGNVAAITHLGWTERLPAGADIAVRMRTGDTAVACAAAAWSTPISDPAGGVPAVTPRRFAQYRVELTSDGDHAPALDSIAIDYSVNP